MKTPFRFRALGSGEFQVYHLEAGLLGEVVQRQAHYNLRRPITVNFWVAYPAERSRPLGKDPYTTAEGKLAMHEPSHFRTRLAAAEALLRHGS